MYSGRSLNGHSRKWTALLMTAFTKPRLNSHTNSVFTHSRKPTFSLAAADTWSAYDLGISFAFKLP